MMIFAVRSWKKQMEWNKRVRNIARRANPEEVPLKTFKPKCSNLEIWENTGKYQTMPTGISGKRRIMQAEQGQCPGKTRIS